MFNAATFDISHLTDAQAKRLDQRDEVRPSAGPFVGQRHRLAVQAAPVAATVPVLGRQIERDLFVTMLNRAASKFDNRADEFAAGKGATCRDLAQKLERFGSFVSDKQAEFAFKLIGWAMPRGAAHPLDPQEAPSLAPGATIRTEVAPEPAPALAPVLPRLFDLMQRLSKLTIGVIQIARKNQDSLCWVKLVGKDGVVGKIEGGKLVLFAGRVNNPLVLADITADLLKIEADPEAAAALHGKLSGRCSVCSRDLTDPASIERGIGPICAEKFQF